MTAINTLDHSALYWIQESLRSDALSPAVKLVTHLGDAGALWILLALALTAFRRTRRVGVTCLVSMVFGLLITNAAIKNLAARPRPYDLFEDLTVIIGRQGDFSFPSGHATNAFACAWVLFRAARRRYGAPALALAVLIALSRLYVGVHYPTDVLAGALVGVLSATCALPLVRALCRRWAWLGRVTAPTDA